MTDRDRIEALAAQYIAAMPDLDPALQQAALTLLRLLAHGEAVKVQHLADACGFPVDYLEAALAAAPGIFRDDRRRITGALGLSVVEVGAHRLHLEGAEVSLTVTPAGPVELTPAGTVISYLSPEERFDLDVVQRFCDDVHFFASAQAAERWTAEHPGTFALHIDDAYRLGRLTNQASFGAGLAAMSGP